MKRTYLLIPALILLLSRCTDLSGPETVYDHYCGSCHLPPSPEDLPRSVWEQSVLPEMGARLGIQTPGYEPMAGKPAAEVPIYERLAVYPKTQLIQDEHWEKIRAYVLENAPDTLPNPQLPTLERSSRFEAMPLPIDSVENARVTNLSFQEGTFYASSVFGRVSRFDPAVGKFEVVNKMINPVSSLTRKGDRFFITEIGQMHPTDLFFGEIWQLENGKRTQLAGQLQRPVHTLVEDLNDDGASEMVVCEFGNQSGALSLFTLEDGAYVRQNLLPLPGAVKVYAEDMDRDGRRDLIVLTSQAREGVWILFQRQELVFEPQEVIQFHPVYGTSGFELLDYDSDGDQDIVIVNGDNADLSVVPKPYHGLRLYINDGKNGFTEKAFVPINGATNVVARDFDGDGDVDFVVSCFFPDLEKAPDRSLIYLENRDAGAFDLAPLAIDRGDTGRWLVLAAGDVDGDGDEDVAVGSFTYAPERINDRYPSWMENSPDVLILRNRTKN